MNRQNRRRQLLQDLTLSIFVTFSIIVAAYGFSTAVPLQRFKEPIVTFSVVLPPLTSSSIGDYVKVYDPLVGVGGILLTPSDQPYLRVGDLYNGTARNGTIITLKLTYYFEQSLWVSMVKGENITGVAHPTEYIKTGTQELTFKVEVPQT